MPVAIIGPNGGLYNSSSTITVDENTSFVFDFDSDQPVIWSIVGQGGGYNPDRFNINPDSGTLSFNAPPDYENPGSYDRSNYYGFYIKAVSVANAEVACQWLGITVRDIFESTASPTSTPVPTPNPSPTPSPISDSTPPGIQGPQGGLRNSTAWITIEENSTDIFGFISHESVTWSISGGQDASKFNINSATGKLSFLSPPDFENPSDYPDTGSPNNIYGVSIKATDVSGNSTYQFLLVTVSDAVEKQAAQPEPKYPATPQQDSIGTKDSSSKTVEPLPKGTETSANSVFKIESQSTVSKVQLVKDIPLGPSLINEALAGTIGSDEIIGSTQSEALFGGSGRDVLTGGGGADAFVFDGSTGFGAQNLDLITDFSKLEGDKIVVSNQVFGGITKAIVGIANGKPSLRAQFRTSSNIIYDTSSGMLYFDANGRAGGFGGGGVFAQLSNSPAFSRSDISIV